MRVQDLLILLIPPVPVVEQLHMPVPLAEVAPVLARPTTQGPLLVALLRVVVRFA